MPRSICKTGRVLPGPSSQMRAIVWQYAPDRCRMIMLNRRQWAEDLSTTFRAQDTLAVRARLYRQHSHRLRLRPVTRCPRCPRKQTFSEALPMSAKCQMRTSTRCKQSDSIIRHVAVLGIRPDKGSPKRRSSSQPTNFFKEQYIAKGRIRHLHVSEP